MALNDDTREEFHSDEQDGLVDAEQRELMEPISFPSCPFPTLGVELELSLVDLETRQLVPRATELLSRLADKTHYKPELFQTIIEVNTDICRSVSEVREDLESRLRPLRSICTDLGIGLLSTGTHPTADWGLLPITDDNRYQRLVDDMQWPARRLLICGMHVHIGVKGGDHAIALLNSLTVFLPHLLALSASSPYWMGRDTGLATNRIKIFEGLPTAGLPPRVTNWTEFVQLMRTLIAAGSITSIREIWWDVRPHPGFGTIEVRVCDGLNTMSEICAIVALIHSLVGYLQDSYDQGAPMPILRHWTLRENKWRAARFGERASLIRNERGATIPISDHMGEWVERLWPTARALGCADELGGIQRILEHRPSYFRQRELLDATGSFAEMIDEMMSEFEDDRPWKP